MMMIRKAGLPALVLLAALAGCSYFDLGEPIELGEGQPSQGVLTVKGVEDGSHYEAEVYDYPDDDVADAADLKDLMSQFELAAIGLGTAGNGTLELTLLIPPEGEYFTADGNFLVVIKVAKDDSAPLRYKAAVPFIGGSAAVEYDEMETAIRRYTVTFDLNYTGALNPPKPQEIDAGGKATIPTPPTRDGHTFGGWYTDAACVNPWNFTTDPVTADITLYAKWTPITALATFAAVLADMEAVAAANTDKTYILPSGSETYTLAITPLTPANSPASVVIDGGGRVVTGSTNRITIDAGVTLTLKNITFKKVPFTVAAGGTLVLDTGAVITGNAGAGVTVSGTSATAKGTLEMKAGASITLNGGSDASGAGVRLEETGGVFTMSGGTISGNIANNRGSGGGVALTGTDGTFTMSGGTIYGNTGKWGVGVDMYDGRNAVFTMNGGKISGNTSNDYGGGVGIGHPNSTFTMNSGEISGNNAVNGGGVSLWCDDNINFNMIGGTIKNNTATSNGGGVYALWWSIFNMTGGEITVNTAGGNGGWVFIGGGTLTGNPQIGSKNCSKGSIYGNTATQNPATNDVSN
jgi:uncharacterized repeat protein (TIGR02543 family)